MSQLINFFFNQLKDTTTALEDKINLQNLKIAQNEIEISNLKSQHEIEISNFKSQHEKDIANLNQRINKLEVNQLMLYDYLNLKQVRPNRFDKIKTIIEYLEETEEEKIKQMIENGAVPIPDEDEIKIKIKKKI